MITVETTTASTRVTIPADDVPPERLRPFLDWLRLEAISRRSRMSEAEADRLAEESKTDWWTRNEDRFTPSAEQ